MEKNLRRARGTLTEAELNRAAIRFWQMKAENLALAKTYLLPPGLLQIDTADNNKTSRQLGYKRFKKIYNAHCAILKASQTISNK